MANWWGDAVGEFVQNDFPSRQGLTDNDDIMRPPCKTNHYVHVRFEQTSLNSQHVWNILRSRRKDISISSNLFAYMLKQE